MDQVNQNYNRLKDSMQNKLKNHWDVKVFGNMMLDEILQLTTEMSDEFQAYQEIKIKQIRPYLKTRQERAVLRILVNLCEE